VIIRAWAALCGVAQRFDLALAREPPESLLLEPLDLPARDPEAPADFPDRGRVVAVDAIAESHDLAL
jgi:hypothetical protein